MSESPASSLNTISEEEYLRNTLERYSGCSPESFLPCVLLTNFSKYLDHFAASRGRPIVEGSFFRVAHCPDEGVTMIDIKIGSPAAALAIDLISVATNVKASVFLGMCGGLRRRYKIGEYLVPVASIRAEKTSDSYLPKEVPALANFLMQRAVTQVLDRRREKDMQESATGDTGRYAYHIGITYTGNLRIWEFDEEFKERLKETKAQGIELECATLFIASYKRKVTLGALLLISDLPLERVKTKDSAQKVYADHMEDHIDLGLEILREATGMELRRVKGSYKSSSTL